MNELEKICQDIEAWWHLLWHHAQAGTLPPAPVPGGVPSTIPPVGGTVTPPAPPMPVPGAVPDSTPPPPGHGATPSAAATTVGTLVGQQVPGCGLPDSDGRIQIPDIAAKFEAGSLFLTDATLPYVPAGSKQAFQIAENCANSSQSQRMGGLAQTCALAAVANPAATIAVGGPAFHLAGQAPGEARQVLPNTVVIPSTLATLAEIVAFYSKQPDYGTATVSGHNPVPKV